MQCILQLNLLDLHLPLLLVVYKQPMNQLNKLLSLLGKLLSLVPILLDNASAFAATRSTSSFVFVYGYGTTPTLDMDLDMAMDLYPVVGQEERPSKVVAVLGQYGSLSLRSGYESVAVVGAISTNDDATAAAGPVTISVSGPRTIRREA
ncbi:hypothetical protein SUGI_0493970 [Cryptomeria japonica]|nr:hypothetical protein SUGI_0493970 [Cryptomeria japonica]